MHLYLMRHGKAEAGPVDEQRALSERGVNDVQAVAKFLAANDIGIGHITHSTLLRAKQTAEIMAQALKPPGGLKESVGFEPWGDVEMFVELVEDWGDDTMVCGHDPFMSDAAKALQGDKAAPVQFKTATVLAFSRAGDGWVLDWVVNPKTLKMERP
jgi:phosphohistidine phosphatase